jgi:hypothetical protein
LLPADSQGRIGGDLFEDVPDAADPHLTINQLEENQTR